MTPITRAEVIDLRFPTSRHLDGSDAMNPDPDYSAAYAIVETDDPALTGWGMTFTIGRGTEICTRAIDAFGPLLSGLSLDEIEADTGAFRRRLAGDSQLRWLGPEKGVMHMAIGAAVNALWSVQGASTCP